MAVNEERDLSEVFEPGTDEGCQLFIEAGN